MGDRGGRPALAGRRARLRRPSLRRFPPGSRALRQELSERSPGGRGHAAPRQEPVRPPRVPGRSGELQESPAPDAAPGAPRGGALLGSGDALSAEALRRGARGVRCAPRGQCRRPRGSGCDVRAGLGPPGAETPPPRRPPPLSFRPPPPGSRKTPADAMALLAPFARRYPNNALAPDAQYLLGWS